MRDIDQITNLLSPDGMAGQSCLAGMVQLPWFKPPQAAGRRLRDTTPRYTMVLPVFNQETILKRFFQEHFSHARLPHDLIVIFDCCSDGSREVFHQAIEDTHSPLLCSVIEIVTPVPYFETACDNLGFVLADTDAIIEFQPDLILATAGYDIRMLDVLAAESVFSVSGRCGHALRAVYPPPRWPLSALYRRLDASKLIGLHGSLIETAGFAVDDTGATAYLCETVNRGPLAFRRRDLAALGFLDQDHFFLGDDDHDINLRAWLLKGLLPAYVPLKVRSNLSEGSTRKPRDPLNAEIYGKLAGRPNRSTLKRFEPFYKPYCPPTAFQFGRG